MVAGGFAVVVGGRLGYVIFYKPELLFQFTSSVPYWGVFDLTGGGMSSHGGMLGVALVVWWYARRSRVPVEAVTKNGQISQSLACAKCGYDLQKTNLSGKCPECGEDVSWTLHTRRTLPRRHSFLHLFDITAISAAVGFFFGRIANFINGELVGRVCDESFRWAVKFPQDMYEWINGPWNYESLRAITPAVEHIGVNTTQWEKAIATGSYPIVEAAIARLINAVQEGGPAGTYVGSVIKPLLTPHHPSQLYAAFLEGLCVFVIMAIVWLKPRKPGVIAGLFGVCYGIARIINEFWRKPDAHIAHLEAEALGITRGQILSIVMVLISIAVIWWSTRRDTAKMGGLLKVKTA